MSEPYHRGSPMRTTAHGGSSRTQNRMDPSRTCPVSPICMPALATIATYAILTCLWSTIFVFYLVNRRKTADYPFAAMLLSVLALDAFKSALESGYFGLVWGWQYGMLSPSFPVLGRPGWLMTVKLVNVAVAIVVVAPLFRTWIPAFFVPRQVQRVKLEGASQAPRDIEQSFQGVFQTPPDPV